MLLSHSQIERFPKGSHPPTTAPAASTNSCPQMWTTTASYKIKPILLVSVFLDQLFVFSMGSPLQNGRWLLKSVSESVFNALSDGTFLFTFHGSLQNQQSGQFWLALCTTSINQVMVIEAAIGSKVVGTIWENIENWFRNWRQKSHTILLKVIYLENKQCLWLQSVDAKRNRRTPHDGKWSPPLIPVLGIVFLIQ